MILNMVGGGGNENTMLNMRVIGSTTKPENPRENTIWVNTEHNIPNFAFATENPYVEYPEEDLLQDVTFANGRLHYNSATESIATQSTVYPEIYTEQYISVSVGNKYRWDYTAIDCTNANTDHIYMWLGIIEYTEGNVVKQILQPLGSYTAGTYTLKSSGFYTPSSDDVVAVRICRRTFTNRNATTPSLPDKESIFTFVNTSAFYVHDASQGTVWIRTSSRSSAPINILKKNYAFVYPNYVYQYIDDEWVPCVANTYQNGEWIAWEVYLYYHGIEYEGITGGWDYLTTESGLDTLDYLQVMSWAAINTSNGYSYPYTLESIDFTTYNTMEFTITQHSGSSSAGTLKVQIVDSLENSNVIKEMSITKADLDENGIYNFDISDVSIAGYIKLSVGAIYTTSGTYHTVNISEIKLK